VRLFDHLAGEREDLRRNFEAELPCGFQIDGEFKFRRLQDRQVGRLGTLENSANIESCLAQRLRTTGTVAHPTACRDVLSERINRRHGVARRERDDLIAPAAKEWIDFDEKRADLLLSDRGEGGVVAVPNLQPITSCCAAP
jgi:hypothetical protein